MADGSLNSERRPRLLFFVTEDWYFCSHRLPLAVAAREAGYEVSVVTRESKHGSQIRAAGLHLIPSPVLRSTLSPLGELRSLFELIRIYRRERPDILHHVGLKPVIYGSIAARWGGCRSVVNALGGLGYVFIGSGLKARLLRPLVTVAFRLLLNQNGSQVILQNRDDLDLLARVGALDLAHVSLIRGSGVDLHRFSPASESAGETRPVVVLASRMLWDKGVGEFVEAARTLQALGAKARFVLAGNIDLENPAAITPDVLVGWENEGVVEWWGEQTDMPAVFAGASVVVLPSYREGLPKVLIEAAACGKPIVATDVPGCRDVVRDDDNGLLVPARDPAALARAIQVLLNDAPRRAAMGYRGRQRAEAEFGLESVIEQTLSMYRELRP